MTYNEIDKLELKQRALLYLVAYNCCWLPTDVTDRFRKEFRLTDRELSVLTLNSLSSNYFYRQSWVSNTYEMTADHRINVLLHMGADPALARRIIPLSSPHRDNLYEALDYAVNNGPRPDDSLNRMYVQGLMAYVGSPWVPKALSLLDDEDYIDFVDNYIYTVSNSDTLPEASVVESLCRPADRSGYANDLLADMLDYFLYIAYGKNTERPVRRVTEWALILSAIKAANHGDFEIALKNFTLALKTVNKNQELKNAFIDFIPQYYYVLTIARVGTPDCVKKLNTLLKKKNENPSMYIGKELARAFVSDKHLPEAALIKYVLERDYYSQIPLMGNMAALLDKYYNLGIKKGAVSTPALAIMRHEMRDYLSLNQDDLDALNAAYGDKPVLTGIHRKQPWEWAIEDILSGINSSDGLKAPKDEAKNRIIYVFEGSELEPKYQSRTKSGRWSAPRNVSKQKFCEGTADFMDDTDLAIAAMSKPATSSYYYYYGPTFDPNRIIPRLVGTDRLFIKAGAELRPVKVEETKPYISVDKGRGGYVVKCPVSAKELESARDGRVCAKIADDHYVVYCLNETEMKIYRRLLDIGRFPDSAAPVLQKFLAQLSDHTQIQSSLLDKKSVSEVDGKGLICLKVESTSSAPFPVTINAMPLENGTVLCTPGVGKAVYYDTVDDKMVRVKRNLKTEMAAYRSVIDLLDDEDSPVSEGDYSVMLEVDKLLDLLDFVKQNPDNYVIEWPKGKEIRLKNPLAQSSWNVGLKAQNGWFDIEGEVRVDDDTVLSMTRLLELVSEGRGRYIRLGENDFVAIDKKLRRQLERLEALSVKNRGKLQISQYGAATLDESVLDSELKIHYDDKLRKLQQRIKDSADLNPNTPRGLKAKLRPYQLDGFRWMMRLASWGAGACLADDMGLGKTVQTIAFLLAKAKEGPALITAPASVVPNWKNELERFAPSLQVSILNKADDRTATIEQAAAYSVILATYGLLNTEVEALSKKEWATVCLDEAHTIKNRDTKMSHAAMELQAKYRIILTGTPIQNHLGELWNLFRFINPGLLGSYDAFRHKFVGPIQDGDKERQRALNRMLKPFLLRRTKDEVIDDLPDKSEITIPVELSSEEMAMYEAMRQKAVADLENATKVDVNTLSELTRLRRAACAISLTDRAWQGTDSKVQCFLDLVADFKGDGDNRMLVFSQFTSFLEIIRAALDRAGEKYLYLDGSTTMKQREKLVQEFREGSCQLFLISLKAGGLGLNLPEANYVLHLDPWWNPAIEQQATDRAYRIGQHRNVTVYHLIAQNTIEEKILRLHRTKRDLADSLLEGTDMAGKLTVADILELMAPEK